MSALPTLSRRSFPLASALVLAGALVWSEPARADGPSRETLAQTLFDEARALYERGSFAAACEKWKASDELDPKGGTVLNLAMCREKEGRIASAWSAYAEARNRSAREGRRDRVAFAEARIKALEPTLPRVRIVLGGTRDASVTLDDAPLPPAAWSTAIPVDPGRHTVRASAPGLVPFATEISVSDATTTEVIVPSLRAEPSAPTGEPARHETPATEKSHVRAVLAWSLVAVGAGGVGVGTYFGVSALDARHEAERLCRANQCAAGEDKNDSARSLAWGSNVGVGLGAAALVTGVVLLLTE